MFDEVLELKLEKLIDSMGTEEQFELYGNYCDCNGYTDDIPYQNNEWVIDELYGHLTPIDLLRRFSGWDENWEYFTDGIYGIEEWNSIEYTSDVVDAIIRNWESYGNDDIQDLLDLYENDLEDYIDNLYEDEMTKEDLIDTVLDSLKSEFEEDFEEIMEQYGNEIDNIINYYFED